MDKLLAVILFAIAAIFLVQRNLTSMLAWVALAYLVSHYMFHMSHTVSVIIGILGVYLICMITHRTYEGFEEEKKEKEPEAAPPKTDDPHVDIGTTILHAYRNLSPEQIGGMRRDTKELMSLQKELMGSLSEMKPAIEQGAELLKTFSQFFGKNE
jgi:predicted membrane protein